MKSNYRVLFWETPSGVKPVAKWMKSLSKKDQIHMGDLFKDLAMAGPHSNPNVFKHIEGSLWEIRDLRTHSPGHRVYFAFHGNTVICLVVHAGSKKSQQRDIDLAKKRLNTVKTQEK